MRLCSFCYMNNFVIWSKFGVHSITFWSHEKIVHITKSKHFLKIIFFIKKMLAASQGHMTGICDLPRGLPTSKVNGGSWICLISDWLTQWSQWKNVIKLEATDLTTTAQQQKLCSDYGHNLRTTCIVIFYNKLHWNNNLYKSKYVYIFEYMGFCN